MSDSPVDFASLGLPGTLLAAISEVGYETPSPIQAQAIPLLLAGRDLLGQAQTGTGKTAAFALPLLARVDAASTHPQLLVLTPTRELALQVAEAMQTYARFLSGFHVLPIYGGQGMGHQLAQLRRGVQVVVGTPGRIMDHMRRGTLDISRLQSLVLDEADEMLRMGFIDDVEWILEHTPEQRQIALFSATMPAEIRKVAERHLREPELVRIAAKTTTAANIRQRYWPISGVHKLDALTRMLETEPFQAVIIFVRTKTQTVELAEKLSARGFAAEALNGDVAQVQRERTVDRLRDGRTEILVATDVVARGLDVKRVSHVINYDIPYDSESYVHRIGRTGRAGATGEAILFVAPRERRMLRTIEKATGQPIEPMDLPSVADINVRRTERFKAGVREVAAREDLAVYYRLVSELEQEGDLDALQIAAALARMAQGEMPLLLEQPERPTRAAAAEPPAAPRPPRDAGRAADKRLSPDPLPLKDFPEVEMERYRIAVGYRDGVKPGNIVGAIANEAELDSQYIGHIEIFDDFSIVDLPAGMPRATMRDLQKAWVCQRQLGLQRLADYDPAQPVPDKRPHKGGGAKDERDRGDDKKGERKKRDHKKDGYKEGYNKDEREKGDYKKDGHKKGGYKKAGYKKEGGDKGERKKGAPEGAGPAKARPRKDQGAGDRPARVRKPGTKVGTGPGAKPGSRRGKGDR